MRRLRLWGLLSWLRSRSQVCLTLEHMCLAAMPPESAPPPRPCCPWPGKLELFLRAGWGMCSPGGCLSHKQLAVGWEMSLPWNRANENMGQETIIIVSHCVNVWCGSGGHNRFQSHTGGLWLLAVSIYAPSPVPPDLWYGSLSGYPWLLQTTAALSPCPGGTGKQLYQRNEEASSPQWLWVFK